MTTQTKKTALITGVTGQDGSYLAEFLLEKGYEVHGIKRRASLFNTQRVDHIYEDPHIEHARFKLHYGDLSDTSNLTRLLQEIQPDEVYNLGAQSHVAVSFEAPEYTADVDAIGTLRLLEDVRKITRGLANIAQGLESCLYMGNIDSLRDWGHAKDYVRMQWMMLQQDKPEDFVIATGVQYSVRQFISWSAEHLGVTLRFEGQGVDEVGIVAAIEGDKAPALKVGDTIVKIDPRYFRPAEVETLLGDPSKAKAKLGWTPEITVQEMCEEMVAADLESAKRHALLKKHGFDVAVSAER